MNSFPSPSPSSSSSTPRQSSSAVPSSYKISSSARPLRSQPSAWASSAQSSTLRRGLTPLATSNAASQSTSSTNTSRTFTVEQATRDRPLTSGVLASTATGGPSTGRLTISRNPSISSTSAFPTLRSGSPQAQQPTISSPRSRTNTPLSSSHLTSASVSSSTAHGGGGSGGGGGTGPSRGATFSPSLAGTAVNSPVTGQSSLSKVTVAQVYLLLDSITEKEGKDKWEAKAAQIHKVCFPWIREGMEVKN